VAKVMVTDSQCVIDPPPPEPMLMHPVPFSGAYTNRRVLVTGHTGFKGSWLTEWLLALGAEVAGFSDGIPTDPSHFEVTGAAERISHLEGDIRDRSAVVRAFESFRPEVVFHLAAQALVRLSYEDPAATFETNTMGTLNVLEATRTTDSVASLVLITSDKAYRNVEWVWGYRENDALGGEDPYSGSKGAAELVAYSYIHSYFNRESGPAVATARAGNVIGGGDWARDRLIPDSVRAWSEGRPVVLRSPGATRPWQHVLEPLSGYLQLGVELLERRPAAVSEAFNFGPDASVQASVGELIRRLSEGWPGSEWSVDESGLEGRPEARLLKLSCDKALLDLQWEATLGLEETVAFTRDWYREYYLGDGEAAAFSRSQIDAYTDLARARGRGWAIGDRS
jgi:CDP-glucose 4,6-dehydratase